MENIGSKNICGEHSHLWGALITPVGGQPPVGSTGHRNTWLEHSHLLGTQGPVQSIATILGSPGEDMLTGGRLLWRPRGVGCSTGEKRTEGGITHAPQRSTTASLVQAFSRALLQSAGFSCWAWPSPEQEKGTSPRILSYRLGLPETLKAKAEEC